MSVPDFERAEYVQPQVIEGEVVGRPPREEFAIAEERSAFAQALLFGILAAVAGSLGYAVISLSGFMVSIVAIGVAWLIARAMMTATGGVGGRPYQIAAVVLTYLAVSWGSLIMPLWHVHQRGAPLTIFLSPRIWWLAMEQPFLELRDGFNGIIGIAILGIGMRAAWRMAAGGPGFGQGGNGRRMTPFG